MLMASPEFPGVILAIRGLIMTKPAQHKPSSAAKAKPVGSKESPMLGVSTPTPEIASATHMKSNNRRDINTERVNGPMKAIVMVIPRGILSMER